jgi:hypothetical protein
LPAALRILFAVPIRASSARHIDALLSELRSSDEIAREVAVARLMVIGSRAVDRLGALAGDTSVDPVARTAALRALEGIGDERALDMALSAAGDVHDGVAVAAVGVVRTFLAGSHDLRAVDALTAIALDRRLGDSVREAALRALGDLEPATLNPVLEALLTDPSARLRTAARGTAAPSAADEPAAGDAWLAQDAADVPDDPSRVRRALSRNGSRIALPRLHHLIERVREREQKAAGERRREWMRARATAHVALATRGSRLAIYDLRESLDAAKDPLPVEFLAALTMVGDASCLEPLAGAYARASNEAGAKPRIQDWWHRHLADAFQAIVAREAMTRRHAVAKKIDKRWPDAFRELWP